MREIFDRNMPVPDSVLDEPRRVIRTEDDFSGAEVFDRPSDPDEVLGRTSAELVGDKLFYGAVGAATLTLVAGAVAAKKLARR